MRLPLGGGIAGSRPDAPQRHVHPLEARIGLAQVVVGVVDGAAVVAAEHERAQHLGPQAWQHLAHGEEVAERLRHLLGVDVDEAVVHPGVHERAAAGGAALGDLVLVVRELQVESAAVDVEVRAQQRHRHRRALDVPARPPVAPGRGPARLAGLGGLPQHEVERIALRLIDLDAGAGPQVAELLAGQLAVALEAADRIEHVAVGGRVGVALLDQRLDHRDDLGDIGGRPRLVLGDLDAERREVLLVRADEPRGQRLGRLAVLGGAVDDVVVDVGDVPDVRDLEAAVPQVAAHDVEGDQRAGVANVAVVVDGESTDVHLHVAGRQWLQCLLAAGQ